MSGEISSATQTPIPAVRDFSASPLLFVAFRPLLGCSSLKALRNPPVMTAEWLAVVRMPCLRLSFWSLRRRVWFKPLRYWFSWKPRRCRFELGPLRCRLWSRLLRYRSLLTLNPHTLCFNSQARRLQSESLPSKPLKLFCQKPVAKPESLWLLLRSAYREFIGATCPRACDRIRTWTRICIRARIRIRTSTRI